MLDLRDGVPRMHRWHRLQGHSSGVGLELTEYVSNKKLAKETSYRLRQRQPLYLLPSTHPRPSEKVDPSLIFPPPMDARDASSICRRPIAYTVRTVTRCGGQAPHQMSPSLETTINTTPNRRGLTHTFFCLWDFVQVATIHPDIGTCDFKSLLNKLFWPSDVSEIH